MLFRSLILWTVREGKELEDAVNFCKERGLEFYAVNSDFPEDLPEIPQPRKLRVELFIDDRNLGGLPDWGVIYRMISSGNPLSPISSDIQSEMKPKKRGFFSRR